MKNNYYYYKILKKSRCYYSFYASSESRALHEYPVINSVIINKKLEISILYVWKKR